MTAASSLLETLLFRVVGGTRSSVLMWPRLNWPFAEAGTGALYPEDYSWRMQVADRIYRLGDRYVNWYVIEQGDKLTVLDAGFPAHWEQLPALLGGIGHTLSDVSRSFRRA